eukprot:4861559-Pyramimonas_sp.AAC.1
MRRLRQWQLLVRYPADGRQSLATPFGTLDGLEEYSVFAPTGMIASSANLWAKQFELDVGARQYLRNCLEFLAARSLLELLAAPSARK